MIESDGEVGFLNTKKKKNLWADLWWMWPNLMQDYS